MGKVEKVVVLSVLFLVTLILVVALGTTENPGGVTSNDPLVEDLEAFDERFPVEEPAPDPVGEEEVASVEKPSMDVAPAEQKEEQAAVVPPATAPVTAGAGDELDARALEALLSKDEPPPAERRLANLDPPKEEPKKTEPVTPPRKEPSGSALLSSNVTKSQVPAGSVLVTLDGLEKTLYPELMYYTWKSTDTLRDVALRYFGDARRTDLILNANEGRKSFLAAEKVWLPVYQLDGKVATPEKEVGEMRSHVVEDGESLWTISKKYYGKGGLWKRIYEANRDVMANENALTVGVKLRIPPER